MTEQQPVATAVQELAWKLARSDVGSPYEPGLTHEQRRKAWLATLAALTSMQAEITRLTDVAAARAVDYGADYPELGAATGATHRAARRRWPRFAALLGGRPPVTALLDGRKARTARASGAEMGTVSAHGRAASSRLDNPMPW